jgi:transposase
MLTKENYVDIHVRFKQGQSLRRIARELGISRNTVKRHLNQQQMPSYSTRPSKTSKLDPFKPYLHQRIDMAKPNWIPASVLFDEIRQRGYPGGVSMLRSYLAQFKQSTPEPVVRFETPPGQQMQIDFTIIRRGKQSLKAFVATLGYSRACYVKFFDHERAEAWQQGLKEAFDYFGGVPQQVLCDNAKALIIERDAYADGQHRYHPAMLEMSKDYGFKLSACRPYRAQTKGKVERFNHYLKNSFIVPLMAELKAQGLELDSELANAKVGPWLQLVAHQRIHGTTNEKPAQRLAEEVSHFLPLPAITQPTLHQPIPLDISVIPPMETHNLQHPMAMYEALIQGETYVAA